MKRLLMLALLVVVSMTMSVAQPIHEEDFNYGGSDAAEINSVSTWVRHSGAVGPGYKASGLSYAGYSSGGVAGAAWFTYGSSGVNDGDVNYTLPTTVSASADVYVSFLVSLDSARATADYFFHVGPSPISTTFRGRVFARSNGAGFSVGLSKSSETRVDDATVLNFAQTYLFVLKYSFNTTTTSDDQVTLYVYESGVPATEPGSPLVTVGPTGSGTTSDPATIGTIAIRQATNTPTGRIDAIRVATSWSFAPLPVQLSSFAAVVGMRGAELKWRTASEVDNAGFEVERREIADLDPSASLGAGLPIAKYQKIGFVAGAGTSTSAREYSYTDAPAPGRYAYRLKQIDRNGSASYYGEVEVEVGAVAKQFQLGEAFPNPFNPSTAIEFSLADQGVASLKVYNVLGQEVATLFNGAAEAGRLYRATWDASGIPSGMYFARLESGNASAMQRMMLVK